MGTAAGADCPRDSDTPQPSLVLPPWLLSMRRVWSAGKPRDGRPATAAAAQQAGGLVTHTAQRAGPTGHAL